jgi:hypothetical protein
MSQVLKEGGDPCGAYLYMDTPSARLSYAIGKIFGKLLQGIANS